MNFERFKQESNFYFPNQFPSQGFVIYFLLHEKEIVYVGKSSWHGVYNRLRTHGKTKRFDEYAVMPVGEDEQYCLDLETALINYLQPIFNTRDCEPSFKRLPLLVGFVSSNRKSDFMLNKFPILVSHTLALVFAIMTGGMLFELLSPELSTLTESQKETFTLFTVLGFAEALVAYFALPKIIRKEIIKNREWKEICRWARSPE